jgi:hypothetical protein
VWCVKCYETFISSRSENGFVGPDWSEVLY